MDTSSPKPKITEREAQTLDLVANGLSNTEIAEATGRSSSAVSNMVAVLLSKVGARNRAALAVWWVTERHAHVRPWITTPQTTD